MRSVHPRTRGYPDRSTFGGNTTIPLEEPKLLGGTYHVHLEAHTVAPWEELRFLGERTPTYPWVPRSQHLWREYHYPVRGTEASWGHIPRTLGSAYCSTLGGNTAVPVDGSAIPWGRMQGSWPLVLEIVFFALLATSGRVSPYRGDPSKAQGA